LGKNKTRLAKNEYFLLFAIAATLNRVSVLKPMKKIISLIVIMAFFASAMAAKNLNPASLVGYWKSVAKSEMDGQFIYALYQEKEFLDTWQMVPYKIDSISADEIIYKWTQDESVGDFSRKTIVKFLPNGNIVIKFSANSDGLEYQKIEKAQWTKEVEAINAEAMAELKGKLQDFADKASNLQK